MTLEIEFTAALVEELLHRDIVERLDVVAGIAEGTLLDLIVEADSLAGITTITAALDGLHIEQIGISQTIEHIVGRGEGLVLE